MQQNILQFGQMSQSYYCLVLLNVLGKYRLGNCRSACSLTPSLTRGGGQKFM